MNALLEKFALPILVALTVAVLMQKPFKFNRNQRILLFVFLVFFAVFISWKIKRQEANIPSIPAGTTSQTTSGDAATSGPKSPAITGGTSSITYGESPAAKKAKSEPAK